MSRIHDYIAWAQGGDLPKPMDVPAQVVIERYFTVLRRQHGTHVMVSPRLLESLLRLAQAHARLLCHDHVTLEDAVSVVLVHQISMGSYMPREDLLLTSDALGTAPPKHLHRLDLHTDLTCRADYDLAEGALLWALGLHKHESGDIALKGQTPSSRITTSQSNLGKRFTHCSDSQVGSQSWSRFALVPASHGWGPHRTQATEDPDEADNCQTRTPCYGAFKRSAAVQSACHGFGRHRKTDESPSTVPVEVDDRRSRSPCRGALNLHAKVASAPHVCDIQQAKSIPSNAHGSRWDSTTSSLSRSAVKRPTRSNSSHVASSKRSLDGSTCTPASQTPRMCRTGSNFVLGVGTSNSQHNNDATFPFRYR